MSTTTTRWDSEMAYADVIDYCLNNPVPSRERRHISPTAFARAYPRHIDLGHSTGKTTAAVEVAKSFEDAAVYIIVPGVDLQSVYQKQYYTWTLCLEALRQKMTDKEINPRRDRFIFDDVPNARQIAEDLKLEYFVILGQGGHVEERTEQELQPIIPAMSYWMSPNGEPSSSSSGVTAADILQRGLDHMKDRAATYDKPEGERSMAATVRAFEAITGISMSEEAGWLFMGVLKDVRSQQGNYRADNYEDGAAYRGLQGEAAARERGGES